MRIDSRAGFAGDDNAPALRATVHRYFQDVRRDTSSI